MTVKYDNKCTVVHFPKVKNAKIMVERKLLKKGRFFVTGRSSCI